MSFHRKFLIALISLLIPFSAVGAAQAANETVSAETILKPRSGSFYKEKAVSSDLELDVVVTPGSGQVLVDPLKNVKVTFPAGMTFSANNKVCTDSQLNSQSPLGSPKTIIDACQSSVVGTGTATILLFRQVAHPLDDPILVAFNAGKTANGQAKLKIYGFSKGTGVGILMTGVLKGRVLDIAIPVLSYDSAVANFNLAFPGPKLDRPDIGISTQGHNPNYVQAICATGSQVTEATFQLGTRDPSTGEDTGPTSTKVAPTSTKPCNGIAGKAKLGGVKVKGPNAVKNGRKGAFKVTVKNNGTATAKKVVVTTNRGGKGKAGNIAPGKSKTVTVKVKIKGKKGKKVAVKFTAKAGKVKASAAKKVRVK
ncbi:MAG: hypothetical protein J0H66_02425 [Solirubrobacterales bacterium]|nr:hypothetical protein [Solirubrobacterales bacterium]OJU95305.1 MAG: hypothetical protein BGO23_05450 [Solirubrobacterales bacterium 67-14]